MTELELAAMVFADSFKLSELYLPEDFKTAFVESFEAGAEWQAKQSPWISVEERLPEKDGTRVWVKSSCLNEQCLVYHKGKFYVRLSDGCYDGGVTHWMYIPEV